MNFISSIISHKYLSLPICLMGGYVLNSITFRINLFAAKTLGLPIDIMEGKSYEEFTTDNNEMNKIDAELSHIDLDKQLGKNLGFSKPLKKVIMKVERRPKVLSKISKPYRVS